MERVRLAQLARRPLQAQTPDVILRRLPDGRREDAVEMAHGKAAPSRQRGKRQRLVEVIAQISPQACDSRAIILMHVHPLLLRRARAFNVTA